MDWGGGKWKTWEMSSFGLDDEERLLEVTSNSSSTDVSLDSATECAIAPPGAGTGSSSVLPSPFAARAPESSAAATPCEGTTPISASGRACCEAARVAGASPRDLNVILSEDETERGGRGSVRGVGEKSAGEGRSVC